MFGYIRIDKDVLKVRDYNLFKAYYCGVCQTLKREYGFPSRYFLSYDVTFLATLLTAVQADKPDISPMRCLANPALRRPVAKTHPALSYAAAVNVLLVWFKLKDDLADNRSVKAALLIPLMVRKRNKARKRYPDLYQKIKQSLAALHQLEQQRCSQPDAVAAAFGQLMAHVFDTELAGSDDKRRVFSHAGFLLGRLIYLLDAWADREEDEKKHAYNPFLLSGQINKKETMQSLDYTLSELANTLTLLEPMRNQEIIENIIYLGLKKTVDNVFSGKDISEKEKHHERPL